MAYMGKYKVLDIFSFLPANVISLEQLEKMFLDILSEISNNTKLGNEEIVVTCSSQSWFTENIKECQSSSWKPRQNLKRWSISLKPQRWR